MDKSGTTELVKFIGRSHNEVRYAASYTPIVVFILLYPFVYTEAASAADRSMRSTHAIQQQFS